MNAASLPSAAPATSPLARALAVEREVQAAATAHLAACWRCHSGHTCPRGATLAADLSDARLVAAVYRTHLASKAKP